MNDIVDRLRDVIAEEGAEWRGTIRLRRRWAVVFAAHGREFKIPYSSSYKGNRGRENIVAQVRRLIRVPPQR